jgi:peptide/nickel transport system permease protein
LRLLASTPSLVAGVAILAFFAGVAALSPLLYPGNPTSLPDHPGSGESCPVVPGPSLTLFPFHVGPNPLGQTAGLGFDVLQGLVRATPWDLLLLLEVLLPAVLIGIFIGSYAGYRGGFVDDTLMALTDTFLAIPEFVVVLLAALYILTWVNPDLRIWVFGLLFLLVVWAPYARTVRARARVVAALPFVEAARASGGSDRRVLFRHVIPNSLYPVFAQVPTTLAAVLAILGGLQYGYTITNPGLCLGLVTEPFAPPPLPLINSPTFPEWTWILSNGASGWEFGTGYNPWWGVVFPALWILLFGLGVILTCDGLNRALSPTRSE